MSRLSARARRDLRRVLLVFGRVDEALAVSRGPWAHRRRLWVHPLRPMGGRASPGDAPTALRGSRLCVRGSSLELLDAPPSLVDASMKPRDEPKGLGGSPIGVLDVPPPLRGSPLGVLKASLALGDAPIGLVDGSLLATGCTRRARQFVSSARGCGTRRCRFVSRAQGLASVAGSLVAAARGRVSVVRCPRHRGRCWTEGGGEARVGLEVGGRL